MFKKQKNTFFKLSFFKLIFLTQLFIALPFIGYHKNANAGLEFQWDNNPNYKQLKWFQKNETRRARNTIFFFLRPFDRNNELLKINMILPKKFDSKLKKEKIILCKVRIGGFESRTKCIENIPADVVINKEENTIDIFPYSKIPRNKDSYAVVMKIFNPKKFGLYQFHSYGQPAGETPSLSYLGSWTIRID